MQPVLVKVLKLRGVTLEEQAVLVSWVPGTFLLFRRNGSVEEVPTADVELSSAVGVLPAGMMPPVPTRGDHGR